MADIIGVNTAQTLSIFNTPGKDFRVPTSQPESIFTFGSFRMEQNSTNIPLTGDNRNLFFNSFSTLDSLNTANFTPNTGYTVSNNELKFKKTDPLSYAYFSSFYTSIASAIQNIINNFPYAILTYDNGTGTTISNYSFVPTATGYQSTFQIPYSGSINQGNIIVNSGFSENITLVNDSTAFGIQLSGDTNTTYPVLSYNFIPLVASAGTAFLQFTISGQLFATGTTFQDPIYIRPTRERYNEYLNNLSRLESQILLDGSFLIPSLTQVGVENLKTFVWPKTIDGFNPDVDGDSFNQYFANITNAANIVDDEKTNIMLKVMIPDNFLDQDTEDGDFRSLVEIYAKQFDDLKQFIDTIAFAHQINYEEEESVPNKFLFKLSNLLGWQLSASFNETDLFEYLVGDVEQNNSISSLNIEIWKRILINLVWLYKKKGTRDALQFIFKVIGAPDALIEFNEFVYDISPVSMADSAAGAYTLPVTAGQTDNFTANDTVFLGGPSKVNENGYINFDASTYIFQEGGAGRGNGQDYIRQWEPEFNPSKRADNVKVYVGDPNVFGTENVINTKELDMLLSPAQAIESDVFDWYILTGSSVIFSSVTLPNDYIPTDPSVISYANISGLTFSQFSDYIYSVTVNPVNRKTIDQAHNSFYYSDLKKIYLFYYYSQNPLSNRITFKSLEFFINLLEVQFQDYFLQLVPATSIFQSLGTEYRNTVFNRQKFVYREGINKGSEFQAEQTQPIKVELPTICVEGYPNLSTKDSLNVIQISGLQNLNINPQLKPVAITSVLPMNLGGTLKPIAISSVINGNIGDLDGEFDLNGTVSGSTVTGATLVLTNQLFANTYTTITDLSGNYSFTNIPRGTYTLVTTYRGYQTKTMTVDLNSGSLTLNYFIQILWDDKYDTWASKANDIIGSELS